MNLTLKDEIYVKINFLKGLYMSPIQKEKET